MATDIDSRYRPEWVARWKEMVNDEPLVPVIGRVFTCCFLLGFGAEEYVVEASHGRIQRATYMDITSPAFADLNSEACWQFALRAPQTTWDQFLQDPPPPFYNDIWAMNAHLAHPKGDALVVEGDLLLVWQHYRSLQHMLDLLRRA